MAISDQLVSGNVTGASAERAALMEAWRRGLTMDAWTDPTDAILDELCTYFQVTAEEARRRCIDWKAESLREWQAGDRTTTEGLADFYRQQVSWIFDTMWYHANQYHGTAPAESVEVALGLGHVSPGHVLDFGAGPGSSALFFHRLGWEVSLADISTTMQDFARWRLGRHGVPATFYDNSRDELPAAAFDLITAFDVMVHVPDVARTIAQLHRSLKPGGYLVFNIDNQPPTIENHGHLYRDQWPILRHVRRTGFHRCPKITYFHVYQKVERTAPGRWTIGAQDVLRYNRFVTRLGDVVRAARRAAG